METTTTTRKPIQFQNPVPEPVIELESAQVTVANETKKPSREELKKKLQAKIKGKSHAAAVPVQASNIRNMLNASQAMNIPGFSPQVMDSAKHLIENMNDDEINKFIAQAMNSNGDTKKKLKKNLKKMLS